VDTRRSREKIVQISEQVGRRIVDITRSGVRIVDIRRSRVTIVEIRRSWVRIVNIRWRG